MTPYQFLRQMSEPMPEWLETFRARDEYNQSDFFTQGRIIFYPGSGNDGHPVKLFGSTRCAHCFVYADYLYEERAIESLLDRLDTRFRGYHSLSRLRLTERDLVSRGWRSHRPHDYIPPHGRFNTVAPYGFLEILERDSDHDDTHGPIRLAILFLGADGFATYDALFCQNNGVPPPFALIRQDHGFGGNYDRFGNGGLLERIAKKCEVYPEWQLVGNRDGAWDGYERVPEVEAVCGGEHNQPRSLYKKVGAKIQCDHTISSTKAAGRTSHALSKI